METRDSTLLGRRSGDLTINQESANFFDRVQEEASKRGKAFFVDTGDGDLEWIGNMECETMQGWLVDKDDIGEFEPQWKRGWAFIADRFFDSFVVAEFERAGQSDVSITFKTIAR